MYKIKRSTSRIRTAARMVLCSKNEHRLLYMLYSGAKFHCLNCDVRIKR